MNIWAIGDPHLSFKNGKLAKPMSKFGDQWVDHPEKIASYWKQVIQKTDLVCVVGDISWALKISEVEEDLEYFNNLPGHKIYIRGNHDFWWASLKKVNDLLPANDFALNGNVLEYDDFVIGGNRLWDVPGLLWDPYYEHVADKSFLTKADNDQKTYLKEKARLEKCLEEIKNSPKTKILLLHYPPTTPDLIGTEICEMIEDAKIDHCIFGHLHGLQKPNDFYGEKNGVQYHLVSCDMVDFKIKKII